MIIVPPRVYTYDSLYHAGPFVMNTYEEISQAIEDYSQGRNGFERAPGWRSEIGKASRR